MPDASDPIRAVDLFCGAGGLSWGLVEALEAAAMDVPEPTTEVLADAIDLVAVNHWERAIETHEANHPWARHFHDDVAAVQPSEVFDDPSPDVKVLSGGIECTHWSTARGGKPADDQKRMPAWDVLTWVQKLRPQVLLFENVPAFSDWGPLEEDGTPTRNGEVFDEWVDAIHALGYSVDWTTLNAADYGDATSRERLFVVGMRDGRPAWPEPTHAEDPDPDSDREPWRSAAEIIDWSDRGESIWNRSRPLVQNTMQRISEGIRRHGHPALEPYADAIGELDKPDVEALQERAVPPAYAGVAARVLEEPFLVAPPEAAADGGHPDEQAVASVPPVLTGQRATSRPRSALDEPVRTVTAHSRGMGLASPAAFVLGQHSNSVARDVDERPAPTICTGGKLQLIDSEAFVIGQHGGAMPRAAGEEPVPTVATDGYVRLVASDPLVLPRNGYHRGLHSNPAYPPASQPLHTVTAKNHDGWLLRPSLVQFSHGGSLRDLGAPLPTVTTARGGVFAVSQPEPYLVPFYGERTGQRARTNGLDDALPTVPASTVSQGLARPFVYDYEGPPVPVSEPLGTLTTRDRYALCLPDLYPWGLDVRFRMLQPRELARAQGFPEDYTFCGNKTETVEQIGNAVPVNLARSLVESLLSRTQPSLTDYLEDAASVAIDDVDEEDMAAGGVASDD